MTFLRNLLLSPEKMGGGECCHDLLKNWFFEKIFKRGKFAKNALKKVKVGQ